MKEVTLVTANVWARAHVDAERNVEIRPEAEVCLVVSEPTYNLSNTGDTVKVRASESYRFLASAAGLRHLAEQFLEFAHEAEELALSVEAKEAEPPVDPEA